MRLQGSWKTVLYTFVIYGEIASLAFSRTTLPLLNEYATYVRNRFDAYVISRSAWTLIVITMLYVGWFVSFLFKRDRIAIATAAFGFFATAFTWAEIVICFILK